jgi:hypothetical protein
MNDTQLVKLWISVLEITAAVVLHAYIIYLCYQFKDSIYKGVSAVYLKSPVLLAACFILSLIFHPGSKGEYFITQ